MAWIERKRCAVWYIVLLAAAHAVGPALALQSKCGTHNCENQEAGATMAEARCQISAAMRELQSCLHCLPRLAVPPCRSCPGALR